MTQEDQANVLLSLNKLHAALRAFAKSNRRPQTQRQSIALYEAEGMLESLRQAWDLPENWANVGLPDGSPVKYVPLTQEECDKLHYAQGSWTWKFQQAHKLGWDAAMKAQHEAQVPKL